MNTIQLCEDRFSVKSLRGTFCLIRKLKTMDNTSFLASINLIFERQRIYGLSQTIFRDLVLNTEMCNTKWN